ncbi:MAG: redox-regulated ATPase YchF [Waddliaceae bacterium]|nr:redox-regulated ATPase YchF [Waddliaceae bacterium]MBT4444522.1 redox-regulated ATPase YchF [Waddliaceae bacterium]
MAGLSCGIVGLPNVGKSTLFNALTANEASASNYPFCTIDPNIGIVEVKDKRLDVLDKICNGKKIVHATMEFVDIAGLVKGASKGEGLGNKFLANIRETDAIVHVVRCFDDENVVHVDGAIDPIRDIEVITLELILADMQMVENSIVKVEKQVRGDKDLILTLETLKKVQSHLNENKVVKVLELSDAERESINHYQFLTDKKVLYAANVSDEDVPDMDNEYVRSVREYAEQEGNSVIAICAKLEEEIIRCSSEERHELLESFGFEESGLDRLIHTSFDMLDLMTFLTTGEIESRAWTIQKGTKAPDAAGKIHTDIQKGFIRVEVIKYDDVVKYNGRNGAKDAGKMRIEGKDYIIQDGDVVLFLHN